MATKVKGFFRGFKQIFAVKEHEMEIGYPTDVKHVSHIGLDASSANAPSWMNEFQTASEFSPPSLGNAWSTQEVNQSREIQSCRSNASDMPKRPKKPKRKKTKNMSSSSSTRSRSAKFRGSCATSADEVDVTHETRNRTQVT